MKILLAEDNKFYRLALESLVTEWGYEVTAVSDGNAAWDLLQRPDAPKLAILDWVMPGMEGPEVCRRLRGLQRPEPTYVIILTSKTGKENVITALESGADDYATKPFDHDELRARLQVGRRIVGLQASQTAVFTFSRAVEAKSPYTQGHADRVTAYALALAARLGVPDREREMLHRGGLLHDIGKIAVPDAILNKPGPLTADEYEVMKQHPVQGERIIEPLQSLHDVIPLIRWHHERPDGRGYPDGLAGEAIPFLVRILSVADVYDALSSLRPYRRALSQAESLEQLRVTAAGGGLDSELVACFCNDPPPLLSQEPGTLASRQRAEVSFPTQAPQPPSNALPSNSWTVPEFKFALARK
jgi:putative two-component system response regulator